MSALHPPRADFIVTRKNNLPVVIDKSPSFSFDAQIMKSSIFSIPARALAVIPLLALAGTAEAGNRRPGGIIIIINNSPQPIVSHLEPPPPAPPAPALRTNKKVVPKSTVKKVAPRSTAKPVSL